MEIHDADVLVTDLVNAQYRLGEAHARSIFRKMLEETRSGQTWGVVVPSAFLEGIVLPDGLTSTTPPEAPDGVTAITGVVR